MQIGSLLQNLDLGHMFHQSEDLLFVYNIEIQVFLIPHHNAIFIMLLLDTHLV